MRMLLNGEWVDRSERIEVRNPQDGSVVDTVPRASADDMRTAIEAAVGGSERARSLAVHRRMAILHEVADTVEAHRESFAVTIACEGIKTIREAREEVGRAVETLRVSAEEARRLTGETIPFDQSPGGQGRVGYYHREPLGIIGAITPFNDPLNLVVHKVGPALAAGNAVIVKPDSKTPLSALKLAEAFEQADVPKGLLQVLPGPGSEVGDALVTDPRVRMISFTGGLETGEAIARKAGLKKIGMELGSNSPVIVLPDADFELAIAAGASGAFAAAGQNCLHVQRLLVHEAIYDAFAQRFAEEARRIQMGDKLSEETDMGPMIDEPAARRVEDLVNEALDAGARLLAGGGRTGTFFAPTVLENVPDHCRVSHEEIYGPVTVLYRFESLNDAMERSNAVPYGLQAGIFTRDLETALQTAHALHYGGVMINDSSDYRLDAMPFGGVKGSGLGREGVRFAMREMTEPKVFCFNRALERGDG